MASRGSGAVWGAWDAGISRPRAQDKAGERRQSEPCPRRVVPLLAYFTRPALPLFFPPVPPASVAEHTTMSGLDPSTSTPTKRAPASGQLTPGGITDQLAQLDLPSPAGFAFPTQGEVAAAASTGDRHPFGTGAQGVKAQSNGGAGGHGRTSSNADELAARLASLPLPNPERLDEATTRARRESISDQLSAQLAGMSLPRPERIFGGDEDATAEAGGVRPDDWDKVTLAEGQEIPEAVRRGSVVGITSPTQGSFPAFAGPPMVERGSPGRKASVKHRGKPSLSSIRDVGEQAEPARTT